MVARAMKMLFSYIFGETLRQTLKDILMVIFCAKALYTYIIHVQIKDFRCK